MVVKKYLPGIFLLFFFALGLEALAAPNITTVKEGTVSHGGIVTINGSGFGTKVPAAPLKWDNFENGQSGQNLGNGWTASGVTYSSEYARGAGKLASLQYFHDSSYNRTLSLIVSKGFYKMYVSGYFYADYGGAFTRNYKVLAYRGDSNWGPPSLRTLECPGESCVSYARCPDQDPVKTVWTNGKHPLQYRNKWTRLESWYDSDHGGSQGELLNSINNVTTLNSYKGKFINGDCPHTYAFFQSYFATDTGSPTPWLKWYWDELYVDITRARIELGNAATWSATTHREIQIPTAWADGSISFKVNQGVFANKEKAYLFVVDAAGNISPGFPVIIGSGGNPTPPPAPTAPQAPSGFQIKP